MQNIKNTEPDPYREIMANFIVHEGAWDALDFDSKIYGAGVIQGAAQSINLVTKEQLELSVMLSNDTKLRELNGYFRNIDKPTNVLSFPYEDEEGVDTPYLGDIAISYETIYREAKEQEKEFQNHFAHMLLHGFLHLLGYDHIEDKDRNEMEALEVSILKNFNISNPYI